MFDFKEVEAPYPGLRPFEPYESEIFFGRENHTDRLLEILQREHFLAVIGPSGCGKSSLVRAGLLPGLATGALGTGSNWRIAILRPGSQPLFALAQALLTQDALGSELVGFEHTPKDDEITADVALVASELRQGVKGLNRLIKSATQKPFNLLILVDQFEELFTYSNTSNADSSETEAFVDLLLAARKPSPHPEGEGDIGKIYVALTMRSDFLGHCVRFLELPEAINHAQYLTPRLNPEELKRAIMGPAQVFNGNVDSVWADKLIQHIKQEDQLPILQHALARMWLKVKDADSPLINESCAKAVGGIEKALDIHAEEVFNSLTPERQILAEQIFRAITERREGGQEVRRPQKLADIATWIGVSIDDLMPVIETFAETKVSFLHFEQELSANSVIDITHEALIRQWQRLRDWVEDEYQYGQSYSRWSKRALEYQNNIGSLLSGGDLALAMRWWNPSNDLPLPEGEGDIDKGAARCAPTPHWAKRYSTSSDNALIAEFKQTRQLMIESRDAEKNQRELEQKRLEQLAGAEVQRADHEKRLAEAAQLSEQKAKRAEQQLTESLFESQLTHASLLARVEDYAEARKVLASSEQWDKDISIERLHSRNLLAGFTNMMGGQAEQVYYGAGAALTGGLTVSPDGKLLAAAGERGTLVLFDTASAQLLKRLEGHDAKAGQFGIVYSVAFDPQGRWLFSSGEDGRIIRWSLPNGDKLNEWKTEGIDGALTISPDGKIIANGNKNGSISLLSTIDGKQIHILEGHTDSITSNGLAFSADGKQLASASYDETAIVWNWKKEKPLVTLQGDSIALRAVCFSPNGKLIATGSIDKQVILWNAKTGEMIRQLHGHQNIILDIAFSSDGNQLLSASRDNTMRLWNVASGITQRIYQGHEAGLTSIALHGNHAYTSSNDATARCWSVAVPHQWIWETDDSPQATAISPDGTKIAVGLNNGSLRIYNLHQGQIITKKANTHKRNNINRIVFNRDGNQIVTAGMDGKAKLWQLNENKLTLLHTLPGHADAIHVIAFSPDERQIATAGFDGKIGLFDVNTGQGNLFTAHEGSVTSIAFSPNNDRLLSTGDEDRRLRLWDINNLNLPSQEIALAQDMLMWASFSPNGKEIAAVGRDFPVSLYDLTNPAKSRRLVGHEQTVFRAIYSLDGHQLATVSADMTARLWDLDSQRLLFTLRLPDLQESDGPWDFDFRCTPKGDCWIAVPLTVGRLALYHFPYENPPQADVD